MSLASKVLVGLVLGIATGIALGEWAGALAVVGRAFILLLQMAVLPFVVVSLVGGLGRLDARQAISIARSGGLVLLLLWAIVMVVVLAFPLAFPDWESASFFSHAMVESPEAIDFLGLYIPANPFASLAQGVVPAIVVFSVAVGVALIGVERKQALIEGLASLQAALERVTGAVVRLAPYGVFALMASAAGTLDPGEFGRLQVYVLVYVLLSLLLVFWVLPGLVATLTPLRAREVLGPVRDALITAFATGNLLIVLPILAGHGREMLQRAGLDAKSANASVDVLVPASFTLPNMGKLLSLAYVPFAGWFSGFGLTPDQLPLFATAGFVSFFGEPVASLPFLLDLMRIPADTFELFITVDVVTSRFGTLLAAVHTLVLALLGGFLLAGRARISWRRTIPFVAVSVALLVGTVAGARLFFTTAVEPRYTGYRKFVERDLLGPPVPVTLRDTSPELSPADAMAGQRLARIRTRGRLRVGYFDDALPFAFRNARGEVVGFDIEMAHRLAGALGVALELVRIERADVASALGRGACDLVMSGTALTPDHAPELRFSTPVGDLTMAFVAPDHARHDFTRWEKIRKRDALTLAIAAGGYYERLVGSLLPDARVVRVASPRSYFLGEAPESDALVTAAEAGSAWTLVYPRFAVAVPQPDPIAVPLAYPMPRSEEALTDFVDAFVTLKRKDGTVRELAAYWFEGKGVPDASPRWSLIRDVLGRGESGPQRGSGS
jgi:Na+/H+-dicarboxylate symporter/ABC-type amino acid transport substrate-binding protein